MQTKITFRYSETQDFEPPFEVVMDVPERSIEEMCEYFQRFLVACGYLFEDGEHIQPVKRKEESYYPGCGGDILTFNEDGSPFCYDFGNK
jgi:hypothetical protein